MSNFEYLTKQRACERWLIVDVETTGREDVGHLLKPVEASKTLKDPDKIAADIEAKTLERDGKLGLDMNTCNIVCVSFLTEEMQSPVTFIPDKGEMQSTLATLWKHAVPLQFARHRKLIGFNIRNFDLPVLIQATRLLGMPEPAIEYGRYSKDVVDIMQELNCGLDNYNSTPCMSRSLKNYCQLFNVPVPDDDCDGKDVAQLVKELRFDEVEKHCAADVMRTYHLAVMLGVIKGEK